MAPPRLGAAHLRLGLGFILAGSSVIPGAALVGLPVFWSAAAGSGLALLALVPLAFVEARAGLRLVGRSEYLGGILRALPLLGVQALFGMALFRAFMLGALARTSAAEVGVAASATPAITALLAALFLGERIGPRNALGIALVVGGIGLVDSGGLALGRGLAPGRGAGIGLALASAASEAVFNVSAKALPSKVGPMVSSAVVTLLAFSLLAALSAWTGERVGAAGLAPRILAALAYQGFFVSALAYVCFYSGASKLSAATIGAFSGLIPLAGLAASVAFLGERPRALALVGAALAVAGVRLCAATKRGAGGLRGGIAPAEEEVES